MNPDVIRALAGFLAFPIGIRWFQRRRGGSL